MTKWEQLAALLTGGNKPNPLLGMMAAQNPLYTADPTQTVDAARAFSQGMSSAAIGSIPGSGVVNAAGIQPRYDENWFIPAGITQGPNIRENLQSGNYLDAGLQGLGILGDAASVAAMASMVPKSAQRGAINLADDLPMDEASRMARKSDMGFYDNLWFHETKPENVNSIMGQGFDEGLAMARGSDEQMPNGVFLKSSSNRIGVGGENAAQIELNSRAQNVMTFRDRSDLDAWLRNRVPEYANITDEIKAIDKDYDAKFKELEKVAWGQRGYGNPESEVTKARDKLDVLLKEWETKQKELASLAREKSTNYFKDQGYDGIYVMQDMGGAFGKRSTDSLVVFDPAKLRSPKAKFDPAKLNSKDLLAGTLPLGFSGMFGADYLINGEK